MLIMMVVLFVAMYFFMIRPQKKQEKQIADMRNSIMVGDEICTNGGIIGRVCQIKGDILTLEINKDRTHMKIYRWAVREIVNPMPRPEKEAPVQAEKKSKKADKKSDAE
ncbi:MAG: preprotein translocase subunit YajC [Ruminococcaceae bacterium]|nr:preprotein translocase subunit YajC [Oscillospiraceae bacterium]